MEDTKKTESVAVKIARATLESQRDHLHEVQKSVREAATRLNEVMAEHLGLVPLKTKITSGRDTYLFSHIRSVWSTAVEVVGFKLKKNGEPGKLTSIIYGEWEVSA